MLWYLTWKFTSTHQAISQSDLTSTVQYRSLFGNMTSHEMNHHMSLQFHIILTPFSTTHKFVPTLT